ncbi:MAG TPA: AmmeMemoRadiSam system protein A [Anaerolineales bacterium]|nr:AmmeMemoRadiSam system protein A [Anaerolineales bacterium]
MLTAEDRQRLLDLARQAVTLAAEDRPLPRLHLEEDEATPALCEAGCAFVTLTRRDALRGCIGALEARQSLVADVWEHAYAAAREDPRFEPVRPDEVESLHIEISRLGPAAALTVPAEQRPTALRPGIDGVILRQGRLRATFLPQVWDKVDDPVEFLDMLCDKAGLPRSAWRRSDVEVLVYQVESFEEEPRGQAA